MTAALLGAVGLAVSGCSADSNGDSNNAPEPAETAFPEKAISLVVAWAAGGGTDLQARKLVETGQKHLGVPVNVVNKPGGSGAVGWGEIAHQTDPDGYTLSIVSPEIGYQRDMGLFDFGLENFTLITMFNEDPSALAVKADAPWDTLEDFLNDAKTQSISVGTAGPGIVWDLAATGIEEEGGIELNHVPFDGAAGSVQALLGGQVDAMTFSLGEVAPQVKAGELKILALAAEERDGNFPDVPTFKEQGLDLVVGTFRGVAGPAGMPEEIVEILNEGFTKMAQEESFVDFMESNSFGVNVKETADFNAIFNHASELYSKLLAASEN